MLDKQHWEWAGGKLFARAAGYPQQDFCCWIGGHGTLP